MDIEKITKLKQLIENIEQLETQKSEISEEVKAYFQEIKAVGFDVNIVKKVIARRRKDKDELSEEDDMLNIYEDAIK